VSDSVTVKPFRRPRLPRRGPNRRAGNFYRAASDNPDVRAGVPLDSIEAAVVAAVRMGYKVASSALDRTAVVGARLREAGDAAVRPDDPSAEDGAAEADSRRGALDATEQIIFKTLLSGLGWLEGVAADRRNPIRRVASAQYQMLGSLLGLLPEDRPERSAAESSSPLSDREDAPPRRRQQVHREEPEETLQIRCEKPSRLVRVTRWSLTRPVAAHHVVVFYNDHDDSTLHGVLDVAAAGEATLTLRGDIVPGRWQAAIYRSDGLQVGYIELTI
jgi:hypothetical protein